MHNMDILDYTDDQLEALSDDELLKLHTKACDKAFEEHINQLTKKILINSLYGATANAFFPLYNLGYASGITCNGRYFIQKTANYIEEKLQSILPWDQKYIVYGDTDSAVSTSVLITDKGKTQIGDFYNSTDTKEIEYKPGKFFKEVNGIKSLSVNKDLKLEYKPIKYVMKHKVKKRLFKIKCDGNEVVITNDHSIMVKRDGKLIEVKPFEIKKTDKLILIKESKNA